MQESLESSVDDSLKRAEVLIEEHNFSENDMIKLQEAILNATEAMDSASAIPLTVDESEADNREDTPTKESTSEKKVSDEGNEVGEKDFTLDKKFIKEKHGYDQDFEITRVTQLAGIAQQAQLELQKRKVKMQSQQDLSNADDATLPEVKTAVLKEQDLTAVEKHEKIALNLKSPKTEEAECDIQVPSHATNKKSEMVDEICTQAENTIENKSEGTDVTDKSPRHFDESENHDKSP